MSQVTTFLSPDKMTKRLQKVECTSKFREIELFHSIEVVKITNSGRVRFIETFEGISQDGNQHSDNPNTFMQVEERCVSFMAFAKTVRQWHLRHEKTPLTITDKVSKQDLENEYKLKQIKLLEDEIKIKMQKIEQLKSEINK